MLCFCRRLAFWVLDFFKGGHYRKNYNEIKFIDQNFNSDTTKTLRDKNLDNILNHSINTTRYYKNLKHGTLLKDFPVINKNIIRDNFEQFQSELFKNKKKYKVSTSGSTGVPFSTYQDKGKRFRNKADTIYYSKKAGFQLGNQLIYIRLWDNQHQKSNISSWIQNFISHDVSNLDDKSIFNLLERLKKDSSKKGFLAYSSAFDVICQYLDKINSKPISCNITSIIGISEGLSDYAKISMEKYFGCPVVSRYSASETGILAQQKIRGENFEINWGSYEIEILNFNDDTPANYGEYGRIVITDLFNYAVPMIRYDTGDIGVMDIVNQNSAPVLTTVEGRKMDIIYNTKGELITSHIVHKICLIEGIKQYQLIQESEKEYCFKINASSKFNQEKELIHDYKQYFGSDAKIRIEYVDIIPLLSSGKRKKVINLYKKD